VATADFFAISDEFVDCNDGRVDDGVSVTNRERVSHDVGGVDNEISSPLTSQRILNRRHRWRCNWCRVSGHRCVAWCVRFALASHSKRFHHRCDDDGSLFAWCRAGSELGRLEVRPPLVDEYDVGNVPLATSASHYKALRPDTTNDYAEGGRAFYQAVQEHTDYAGSSMLTASTLDTGGVHMSTPDSDNAYGSVLASSDEGSHMSRMMSRSAMHTREMPILCDADECLNHCILGHCNVCIFYQNIAAYIITVVFIVLKAIRPAVHKQQQRAQSSGIVVMISFLVDVDDVALLAAGTTNFGNLPTRIQSAVL